MKAVRLNFCGFDRAYVLGEGYLVLGVAGAVDHVTPQKIEHDH